MEPQPLIEGFDYRRLPGADGVELNAAVGGVGSPIVLLHGFPQTHLMWRHVAADLAADHTVICPDLRGYGDSGKPADVGGGATYAKRTMAADVVALAGALGHDRFAVAGHDRGALVALRAGLDHPGAVTHVAALDVLPVPQMWEALHGRAGAVGFHLYLMAQPADLPEKLIAGAPEAFFGHFLDSWSQDPAAIPPRLREVYVAKSAAAVDSIVADYRASAGVDADLDEADQRAGRQLAMPVSVLQQDWGAVLGYDAPAMWRPWALDLHHVTVSCGHFMAEEAPAEVVKALRALLAR